MLIRFETRTRLGEFARNGLYVDSHSIDGWTHLVWDVPHSFYGYVCVRDGLLVGEEWKRMKVSATDEPICRQCLRLAYESIDAILLRLQEPLLSDE